MPFNINGWELIVLVFLFLLLFGPDRLPQIAVQLGRAIRELRRASEAATSEIMREFEAAAREGGSSTDDLREAGDTVRHTVQDVRRTLEDIRNPVQAASRALTDALTAPIAPPGESGSATAPPGSSQADDRGPDGGGAMGAAAPGDPGAVPDPAASTNATASLGVPDDAGTIPPDPIDADLLARRIAPFDLDDPHHPDKEA